MTIQSRKIQIFNTAELKEALFSTETFDEFCKPEYLSKIDNWQLNIKYNGKFTLSGRLKFNNSISIKEGTEFSKGESTILLYRNDLQYVFCMNSQEELIKFLSEKNIKINLWSIKNTMESSKSMIERDKKNIILSEQTIKTCENLLTNLSSFELK